MGYIARTAEAGRMRWAARNLPGVSVTFPNQLSRTGQLKYLPVGLYYSLMDKIATGVPPSLEPAYASLYPFSKSGRPACSPLPTSVLFSMAGNEFSGSADKLNRIKRVIDQSGGEPVTLSQIAGWYKETYGEDLVAGELRPLLKELERMKVIHFVDEGKVKRYSQVAHIRDVTRRLADELKSAATLTDAVSLIEKAGRELFADFRLYLDAGKLPEAEPKVHIREVKVGEVPVYWVASETTREFYSPNHESSYIDNLLNELGGEIALGLQKITQREGRDIRTLWEENFRNEETHQEPFSPTQFHGGSRMFRSGHFSIEYTRRAAKDYRNIPAVFDAFNAVVVDVTGEPMTRKELEDHVYVEHCFTDRFGEEVTGFALAEDYTDYVNASLKVGRLVYYAGIMIKKQYRGGRFANLTHRMMLEIFRGLGWFRLLRGKTPLVYRTQDERIHNLGIRYFSARSRAESFSKEDWQAVWFVAGRNRWKLEDGTNITRGCYTRRMADKEKYLMSDLGDTDGKVCVGYVSLKSLLTLLWDVYIKKRVRFNGDNGKAKAVSTA